jgi:hypothetical protein
MYSYPLSVSLYCAAVRRRQWLDRNVKLPFADAPHLIFRAKVHSSSLEGVTLHFVAGYSLLQRHS